MNVQLLTPELLRLIARKAMVPLAIMVVLGSAIYYFNDEFDQSNVQRGFVIDAANWEIAEINERIASIDLELGVIREKGRRYDQILQTGFTLPQSRLEANGLLEELSAKYDIESLAYSFEPASLTELTGRNGVEFDLAKTEIAMEIAAHTDFDIAGFVAEFVDRLPGQMQIRSFSIVRKEPITNQLMQRIAARGAAGAFFGIVRLNWNNVSTDHPDWVQGEGDGS